jgi:hypothetical protein
MSQENEKLVLEVFSVIEQRDPNETNVRPYQRVIGSVALVMLAVGAHVASLPHTLARNNRI